MNRLDEKELMNLVTGDPELLVLVDLDTGEEIHYRDSGAFGPMDKDFSGLDLFERTARYADEYVVAEEREGFLKEMDPEKLRNAAASGLVTEVNYTAVLDGEMCRLTTRYIPVQSDGHVIAIKAVTFT